MKTVSGFLDRPENRFAAAAVSAAVAVVFAVVMNWQVREGAAKLERERTAARNLALRVESVANAADMGAAETLKSPARLEKILEESGLGRGEVSVQTLENEGGRGLELVFSRSKDTQRVLGLMEKLQGWTVTGVEMTREGGDVETRLALGE